MESQPYPSERQQRSKKTYGPDPRHQGPMKQCVVPGSFDVETACSNCAHDGTGKNCQFRIAAVQREADNRSLEAYGSRTFNPKIIAHVDRPTLEKWLREIHDVISVRDVQLAVGASPHKRPENAKRSKRSRGGLGEFDGTCDESEEDDDFEEDGRRTDKNKKTYLRGTCQMSGPRTKRQFAGAASDPAQRQITNYFTKTGASTGNGANSGSSSPSPATGPPNAAPLPPHVQANLLSVGMRVRKSIPEGYKTGSAYSGFSLWTEGDDTTATTGTLLSPSPTARPAATSAGGVACELTPFCGIHKVGGLAVQQSEQSPAVTRITPVAAAAYDDMPGLTSSQESIASETSTTSAVSATNRKRIYAGDEEDAAAAASDGGEMMTIVTGRTRSAASLHGGPWRSRSDWLDGEMNPKSMAPPGWGNARIMATPKRRGDAGAGRKPGSLANAHASAASLARLDQENMAVDDFEEAAFLDYRLAGDMEAA
ncbi:ribonucleotide reductase inhibitor-domain-containing protein [Bombardia bombarda]|uniref:Ribonucleotide reductase inhibitor-domain-containing protein n=1 Tax=Bombardia bombarda TaxID=252184 RepID=A0AA39TIS7_9PEZI|nr:ribonucleotide reductase inhibitor-domain-containing protein [Bombardia bombarda]